MLANHEKFPGHRDSVALSPAISSTTDGGQIYVKLEVA